METEKAAYVELSKSALSSLCSSVYFLRGHSSAKTFSLVFDYQGNEFPHEIFMEEAVHALLAYIKSLD